MNTNQGIDPQFSSSVVVQVVNLVARGGALLVDTP